LCDATNQKAIKKLFNVKQRSLKKPLPIFIRDIVEAKKIGKIDNKKEKFLKSVWPGKTTVILVPKKKFPNGIGIVEKEIGLRISAHKFVEQLLNIVEIPITSTSANISGESSSTKIKDILKQFENQKIKPDLIIDAGNLPKNKPSKIIDLTVEPYKTIRL
jgi:L-threonylcarbamoyladenylate synthase